MKDNDNLEKLEGEKLDAVSGGGIALPGVPGIPYVTTPGDPKEEDELRDGGATFSW